MSAEVVDAKVEIVRAAAGDRLAELELNNRACMVAMGDTLDAAFRQVRERVPQAAGLSKEFLITTPFALTRTPSKLVEDLLERRERWGISYVIGGPEGR